MIISTGASAKWLACRTRSPARHRRRRNGLRGVRRLLLQGPDRGPGGAGDTAAEEATYLAKLCPKVYMLVRKEEFRASKAMVHRVENTPNIEVLFNTG